MVSGRNEIVQNLSDQRQRFDDAMRDFMRADVETGISFASIGLNSPPDDKRRRMQTHARRAYDTVMYFWQKHPRSRPREGHELVSRMQTLKRMLIDLGENFEE